MITERLKCILKYAQGKTAADIGTDHAYIPIELIKTGRADFVIASDINKGPLLIAENNIKNEGLSDKIETRLGSGISVLKPSEADIIIIAGMGGELIQSIIEDDLEIAYSSQLILQPMNSQYELRKYLILNGFKITHEDIAIEGFKVYNVMVVSKGVSEPFEKDIYYHLPPYLKENEFYKSLYDKKHREFTKVIYGLEQSSEPDYEKLNTYKAWLGELEKY